jgi:predicted NAD/FAD-binding protein
VTSVASLESEEGRKQKIQLVTADGNQEVYDHVILACHSDEALKILRAGGITEDEDRILSQIEWSRNEVVLHSDVRVCFNWPYSTGQRFTDPIS